MHDWILQCGGNELISDPQNEDSVDRKMFTLGWLEVVLYRVLAAV